LGLGAFTRGSGRRISRDGNDRHIVLLPKVLRRFHYFLGRLG
jgi:hypothetical protein